MLKQLNTVGEKIIYGIVIFAISCFLTIFVLNYVINPDNLVIPHKIHYVWFGHDAVPPTVAKAIKS